MWHFYKINSIITSMDNEVTITKEQFENLLQLSDIEIAANTPEAARELVSRALIAIERKSAIVLLFLK